MTESLVIIDQNSHFTSSWAGYETSELEIVQARGHRSVGETVASASKFIPYSRFAAKLKTKPNKKL